MIIKTNYDSMPIYFICQFHNKFMFSTTNPTQIRNNPSNTSTSKHQWSFSKASRFNQPKSNCNRSCYQTTGTFSARKASIGYGSRSKYFDGNKQTIDPCKYNMSSSFDFRRPENSRKGYNFGYNRNQLSFSNYLTVGEKTPGPNNYEGDSSLVKKKKAYSLRPKTAYPKNYFLFSQPQAERKSLQPGPGKYETMDQFGTKYMNSKSKNLARTSFFGNERFHKEKKTPGPGDYTINTIEPDGRYVLSNMRGSGRRAIMQGKRVLKLEGNKQTPGPGAYRQPSDFGHYQSNVRPKTARR